MVHPATFAVNENSPAGTVVGTVTFTDPDVGQTHTFAITAGNTGGAFAIDPSTGQITVAGGINYEVTPSFSLTVQVTDGGSPNLSGTATITIGVIDVNEAPIAGADSYNALGNTQLRVAGAPGTGLLATTAATGVLANDSDPDTNPAFHNLTLVAATGSRRTVVTTASPPTAASPTRRPWASPETTPSPTRCRTAPTPRRVR